MKLELKNLTKKYGSFTALDKMTITFEPGIYGILGANGAGKSTMMNLLTDNIPRTGGEILFDGTDILKLGKNFRKVLGVLPQQQGFYEHMTAQTFLYYMADLKAIPKKQAKDEIEKLLAVTNLSEVRHKKLGGFSGGMKQRALLAQALLGDPKVVILDEPTAGLDPKERIRIRNFISSLSRGKIILLATHIVSDIESIANKIILLKEGKLIAEKTPAELLTSVSGKLYETICDGKQMKQLMTEYKRGNISQREEGIVFRIVAEECPCGFVHSKATPDMEDVYLYYFE